MLYLLDTNVLVRYFINDNAEMFEDCHFLMSQINKNVIKVVIPGIVLTELSYLLKTFYELDKDEIVEILEALTRLKNVDVIDNYDYNDVIQKFKNKNVKYVDCLIGSLADKLNANVISYDKDFDKLGINRVEPSFFIP